MSKADTNQASEDELEQHLLNDKAFQHILKFAPESQCELMTFELARYINALIEQREREARIDENRLYLQGVERHYFPASPSDPYIPLVQFSERIEALQKGES